MSRNAQIAHLNLADLAEAHSITQGKVREIAFGLINSSLDATPENIAQVVAIYTAKNCDPLLAIDELAKQSPSQPVEDTNESDLVQLLADQSWDAIAPLVPVVKDMVTARFLVEVGTGFANGESVRNPGSQTKSVLGVFKEVAKSATGKLPAYNARSLFAPANSPLAIAPAGEHLG